MFIDQVALETFFGTRTELAVRTSENREVSAERAAFFPMANHMIPPLEIFSTVWTVMERLVDVVN